MRMHWHQVRRARGLPMPLPPTPKRPIGPPLLFDFRCVAIRTRADAIEASGSWEEFLDDMADRYIGSLDGAEFPMDLLQLVERLVPRAELQAHRKAMRARCEERRAQAHAVEEAFRVEVEEKGTGGIILDRLFGWAR